MSALKRLTEELIATEWKPLQKEGRAELARKEAVIEAARELASASPYEEDIDGVKFCLYCRAQRNEEHRESC